jgi:hypothetical protein
MVIGKRLPRTVKEAGLSGGLRRMAATRSGAGVIADLAGPRRLLWFAVPYKRND